MSSERHDCAVIMEHSRTQWRLKQRCGNQADILEPYYDVVDNQEIVHNVHIQPAKPMDDEREYADRDLPRSSSAQSLSYLATGNPNVHPTYPPRKTTLKPAPAINRDLKPRRRKKRTGEQLQSLNHHEPPSRRCPPSPQFPSELVEQLNGMTLQENRKERQRATRNVSEFGLQNKGSRVESVPSPRFSMDLEAQQIAERWSNDDTAEESVNMLHFHHEWPQTKEEFDQNDFVPMEKPQTHWDDDWYIGACSRTDAEHALHLVNKDGAFLVRDCSLNSNSEPLVLSVYHEKKVYNVKIRFIENSRRYALGTGQRSNEMFDSVTDIIKFHSIFPIVLISGKNLPGTKCPENCILTYPVTKRDVDKLLQ